MPESTDKVRLRLVLGKYQVKKVSNGVIVQGQLITLDLGNSVTMTADCPINSDTQVGDYLTLYTEVLSDAQPSKPPVQ